MATRRDLEDWVFPRATCAWACVGLAELGALGLLVEIEGVALRTSGD